jgi:hypothetical protein
MQKTVTSIVLSLSFLGANAQTTADLQNLNLSPNSFYNGANGTPTITSVNSFTSGNCIFPNKWSGNFGGYWSSGWSYSNKTDSLTSGSGNQYSARTAAGYTNSTIYAVAQGGAKLKFNATAQGKQMAGFYVTNSTYAALSMRNGDQFAKKFGGVSGNDPDWFKLKIQKYLGGILANDSVVFYLADFRFTNNAQDYVVKTWQYVDLTSLGNVDSLVFNLSSSDNTGGYMNTPNYFCLDNFNTLNSFVGLTELSVNENAALIYPNPTSSKLNISSVNPISDIKIFNSLGMFVSQLSESTNDIGYLPNGIYYVKIMDDKNNLTIKRLIKN